MPFRLLLAYARAIPRLQAEEELRLVRVTVAPWMRDDDRARYLRELEEAVRPPRRTGLFGSKAVRAWFQAWGLPVG